MGNLIREEWLIYADATAFLGNSLLGIVNQAAGVSLRSSFWEKFPSFSNDELRARNDAMNNYVAQLREQSGDSVRTIVDEYDRLFTGEEAPAVCLWESAYSSNSPEGSHAAESMAALLDAAGLELRYVNNTHADEMGIELLYLSVQCERAGKSGEPDVPEVYPEETAAFIENHPLAWVASLKEAVGQAEPHGYYFHLLAITEALLKTLHQSLSA